MSRTEPTGTPHANGSASPPSPPPPPTGHREAPSPINPLLPQDRVPWGLASAWILYDFANTIYPSVITYLLVPFFAKRFAETEFVLPLFFFNLRFGATESIGFTQTASMIASGLMVPVMSSLCDRTAQTRLFLVLFTVLCIACNLGWSATDSAFWLLLLLAVGNLSYNNALTFYNGLLPSVSPSKDMGTVSGLGVGIGYLGTILTILIALFLSRQGWTFAGMNGVLAVTFAILAAPCLLYVPDNRVLSPEPFRWRMVADQFVQMGGTLRKIAADRTLRLFFLGSFFLIDVLNTAVLYFVTFTQGVFAMSRTVWLPVLGDLAPKDFALVCGLALCSLALVCGILAGKLADRLHPLTTMRWSGWSLLLGLLGGIFAGGRSGPAYMLAMCLAGGFGLAGIWTCGRQLLVWLAPREHLGEYLGLYGITNKLSVVGSTTFAVIAGWSQRSLTEQAGFAASDPVVIMISQKEALTFQLVQVALGLVCLYSINKDDVTDKNGESSPPVVG